MGLGLVTSLDLPATATGTCADCDREGCRIQGRGLCSPCYSRHHYAGTLDDFPPRRRAQGVILEEYEFLKPFGLTEFGPHGASNPPGDYDYVRLADGLKEHFPRASFFLAWHGKWALSRNRNARALLDLPEIVNREDLPSGLGANSQ